VRSSLRNTTERCDMSDRLDDDGDDGDDGDDADRRPVWRDVGDRDRLIPPDWWHERMERIEHPVSGDGDGE
jgi:hypothetical protein